MALNIAVLTIVIFLLPMLYLLLASPAFLLVRLDIPEVAYLLRTMFLGYFTVLSVAGLIAATLNALDGQMPLAFVIVFLTALALVWRRWMMAGLDGGLAEVRAGVADVAPRLRRLHWMGMAVNAAQIATLAALILSLIAVA